MTVEWKEEEKSKGTPEAKSGMGAGNGTLLSVSNLHVWYELKRWGMIHAGYVKAVDGVDFDLQSGESIGIVGESGCGKTTLMRTILGLVQPIKGSIVFNGGDISTLGDQDLQFYRSEVGYVQQDPYGALPPFMDLQQILEEPMIIHGVKSKQERIARIEQVLKEIKMTPVEDFLDKFPHMLSGGQQQRAVIARAMVLEPKLLVADEPVSMLDASVRVEILRLMQDLQASHNLAVLYITHDLSTVRYFTERIFVMYAGKIVEKARVDELLDDPQHPYTQALLTATPDPDYQNALTYKQVPPGEPPSLVNPPPGCRYHPRCPHMIEGLCDVENPPRFEPTPGHFNWCWLYDQGRKWA